ncbi:protein disulfide oxidoreductase [Photobacterium japonica]|uniref:protein disulfide oxidoreductase n=1 Tax=Photobacterium japonica TaxID=2910235 RepID=UPI003D0B961C
MTTSQDKHASAQTGANPPSSPRWKRWLKEAVWMLILVTVVSMGVDMWRSRNLPTDTLPTPHLQTLLGEQMDLAALSQDEPVMLYFWGSWCSVCRFVSPAVNWLADDYRVITVALNSGDDRRLAAYLDHHDYRFTTINDQRGNIMKAWGFTAVPTVVIIEKGKVASVTTGFTSLPGLWLRLQ